MPNIPDDLDIKRLSLQSNSNYFQEIMSKDNKELLIYRM